MASDMPVAQHAFGTLADGRPVTAVLLANDAAEVAILTYGATLQRFLTADRDGKADDILLGFDTISGYLADTQYLGATVGRTANRIGGARFTLDGTEYRLDANEPPNQLHGGAAGLHAKLWEIVATSDAPPSVTFAVTSSDGEGGYPGNIAFEAQFTLDADRLTIAYRATTDRPTVIGMTSHGYFNLSGGTTSALDHTLTLFADAYTPLGAGLIPTGEIAAVAGTGFDFRAPRRIATTVYDDNFVVRGVPDTMRPVARLACAATGRVLDIASTAPALQFYAGAHLGGLVGKGERVHAPGDAVCLEPQAFPDAPNKPQFPSVRHDPDTPYAMTIGLRFGVA